MKVSLCVISLILISKISITYPQEATLDQKGLGASSCMYLGDIDVNCKYDGTALKVIPDSCTSFVFYGLIVNSCYEVSPMSHKTHNDALLDKLCCLGKKVYAFYGRALYADWKSMLAGLACNDTNALNESKGINAYTKKHPGITGLILYGLEPDEDPTEFIGFTGYLMKYIEIVKKETGLEIAFHFVSNFFYKYYEKQTAPWLDFTVLNPCVDFYVFSILSFFNNCSEITRNGVYLIDGSEPYTLEKLSLTIANKSKIPTEKLYYSYPLVPESIKNETFCVVNNERLCKFPDESKCWCADTQETLFEKGQWFKKNAVGFVGGFINTDDPHDCCNCGPFPGYNAILAGFNGSSSAPSCPLFDRLQ